MAALIARLREPFAAKLAERLALTEGLLYRRGNFNGTFDEVLLDALLEEKGAEIAFSPGFRWGTSLLPGEAISYEYLMGQTAITYPGATLNTLSGEAIKATLEDIADNLFNPDPYYQQGGDMVRVGGLRYSCNPYAPAGKRIGDMTLAGKPIDPARRYKVAGWASVSDDAAEVGEPVWEIAARYLKSRKSIAPRKPNRPRLVGVTRDPGIA